MDQATRRPRAPRPPRAPVLPLARVLVADPDALSLARLGDALDAAGIRAVRVRDGGQALSHPELASVSVIVARLEMPRVDGLELLLAVQGAPATAAIPVVLVSSRPLEEVQALARPFGQAEVLAHPVESEALLAAVRRLAGLQAA